MAILTEDIINVLKKSEIITIATAGETGPHLVATWGDYVAKLLPDDGVTILIPAGGYKQTEKNLARNDRVVLMAGSKEAPGKNGMGTGYRLTGRGKMVTDGKWKDLVAAQFAWARAAFVIEVESAEQLL